jgi:hypothetical protein
VSNDSSSVEFLVYETAEAVLHQTGPLGKAPGLAVRKYDSDGALNGMLRKGT